MQSLRKVIVYCRVSSPKQKQELQNQQSPLEQFCLARGLEVDEYLLEIGGGMNFKRRQFLSLVIDGLLWSCVHYCRCTQGSVVSVAFDLIETLISCSGTKIIVVNQELVEDLLAIIHCFSCRLYRSRTYANQKVKAVSEILNNPQQYQRLGKSVAAGTACYNGFPLKLGKRIKC